MNKDVPTLPFTPIAAIGLSCPLDIYSRVHHRSGAGSGRSGFLLLVVQLQTGDMAMLARALAGFVSAPAVPVSAHLSAFLTLITGYSMANQFVFSEMAAVNNE